MDLKGAAWRWRGKVASPHNCNYAPAAPHRGTTTTCCHCFKVLKSSAHSNKNYKMNACLLLPRDLLHSRVKFEGTRGNAAISWEKWTLKKERAGDSPQPKGLHSDRGDVWGNYDTDTRGQTHEPLRDHVKCLWSWITSYFTSKWSPLPREDI